MLVADVADVEDAPDCAEFVLLKVRPSETADVEAEDSEFVLDPLGYVDNPADALVPRLEALELVSEIDSVMLEVDASK